MIRPIHLAFLTLFVSCKEKKTSGPSIPVGDSAQTRASPYFPVKPYLQSQIREVDSLPGGIMKYIITEEGRQDSGYIKAAEFHELAADYIPDDLSEPYFTEHFTEASFFDKSNGSGTFFYAAKDNKASVKRIDVVSSKGDVYDNVKSIYLETMSSRQDTVIIKKMYWKPGRYFQTITQKATGHTKPVTEVVKVVWDNRD